MSKNHWTREQTIVALATYCKIPFNLVSSKHPEVVKIAQIIGRSPNAVKMKIGNFGSFDPELKKRDIVGLGNTSNLDEEIWSEFYGRWDRLAFESEKLKAEFVGKTLDELIDIDEQNLPIGKDRLTAVKSRVNQDFFRAMILSAYNQSCCITGLNIPELLVASHIVPWAIDVNNRVNPRNGLCLNALHDKAFDSGLICISENFRVVVSKKLKDFKNSPSAMQLLNQFDKKPLELPERFIPSSEFLEFHRNKIFLG